MISFPADAFVRHKARLPCVNLNVNLLGNIGGYCEVMTRYRTLCKRIFAGSGHIIVKHEEMSVVPVFNVVADRCPFKGVLGILKCNVEEAVSFILLKIDLLHELFGPKIAIVRPRTFILLRAPRVTHFKKPNSI